MNKLRRKIAVTTATVAVVALSACNISGNFYNPKTPNDSQNIQLLDRSLTVLRRETDVEVASYFKKIVVKDDVDPSQITTMADQTIEEYKQGQSDRNKRAEAVITGYGDHYSAITLSRVLRQSEQTFDNVFGGIKDNDKVLLLFAPAFPIGLWVLFNGLSSAPSSIKEDRKRKKASQSSDVDLLGSLSLSKNVAVRMALASNRHTTVEIFSRLATDPIIMVRIAVTKSLYAPEPVLIQMAGNSDMTIRNSEMSIPQEDIVRLNARAHPRVINRYEISLALEFENYTDKQQLEILKSKMISEWAYRFLFTKAREHVKEEIRDDLKKSGHPVHHEGLSDEEMFSRRLAEYEEQAEATGHTGD